MLGSNDPKFTFATTLPPQYIEVCIPTSAPSPQPAPSPPQTHLPPETPWPHYSAVCTPPLATPPSKPEYTPQYIENPPICISRHPEALLAPRPIWKPSPAPSSFDCEYASGSGKSSSWKLRPIYVEESSKEECP
ncbi:classical arabinogalactan protein 9-like [Belonocnema kinseyi]|uniref:classical arabinogalactan protein 9-like n=1 Tax=Belonocnema kinseyi TaxID=2817044 RepID=UPI00143CD95A|nr:classical arabinogalactan protein 9-like [Belonocnema kinseyi]